MNKNKDIYYFYKILLNNYGPQGWWPLMGHKGTNPTKTGATQGYHPKDYSFPKDNKEQFEIAVGAILTQNTAWTNVELALKNLYKAQLLNSPQRLLSSPIESLKELVKPAGYFNQKTKYLREMANFFIDLSNIPTRNELLNLKGVGNETADTILLYAFKQPSFIIDTYTKRFLEYHGLIESGSKYMDIQKLFQSNLSKEWKIYQEYHALIVEHGKSCFSKKPYLDNIIKL